MAQAFKFPFAIKTLENRVEHENKWLREMHMQYDENHRLIEDPEKFDERTKSHIVGINARKAELIAAIEFMKTVLKD